MPITLSRREMMVALETAFQRSRSSDALDPVWDQRIARIEASPSKTHVAALGGALLAKATDPRVDSLSNKKAAGERGYSLRTPTELLSSQQSALGFHLGATGRNPLNNAPFYGGHARIDRIRARADAQPFHDDLVRYLTALDSLDRASASEALAVFLRRRREAARRIAAARRIEVERGARRAWALISALDALVERPSEGGRIAQAVAAAVLDTVHPVVKMRGVNDPMRLDVRVVVDERTIIGAEAKQTPVDESVAYTLASDTAGSGCDKAILLALGQDQPLLDRARIRNRALREHGVICEVATSPSELLGLVAAGSATTLAMITAKLPHTMEVRLLEIGADDGLERWRLLMRDS